MASQNRPRMDKCCRCCSVAGLSWLNLNLKMFRAGLQWLSFGLSCLCISLPLTYCVETKDVIGCLNSYSKYICCHQMRNGTLPNLDISYNCSHPDNVTIILPQGTNRTTTFRLFHSNLCVTHLPQDICDYTSIVSIKYDFNSLTSIPSLSCLKNLIALDLSHNEVEVLKNDTFLGLTKLRFINLQFNRISHIEPHTFKEDLYGLMTVLLDFNLLKTAEPWFMSIKHHFCLFGVSNNKIEGFSNEENWHVNVSDVSGSGMVDLSNNQLTTFVTKCAFQMFGFKDPRTFGVLMHLGFDVRNNPWICDCQMYEFLKLASNLPRVIWRRYFEVYCQSPPHLKGTQIIDVPMSALVCNTTEKCPPGCFCQNQPDAEHMFVDCRDGQLHHLPLDLPDGNLKLLLSNNSITSLEARPYLSRTRYIDMSRNGLEYVSTEAIRLIQQTVKILDVSCNKLHYLPEIIQNIPFSRLMIGNNSYACDCNSTWMFRWLRQQEVDVSHIVCSMSDKNPIQVVQADARLLQCDVVNPIPRILSFLLGTLALVFIMMVIVLIVFRHEALILLHTNLKTLSKPRTDLDQDVFVSVNEESEIDRVWVVNSLLPELEQKHDLKLYLSPRDMDPGTVIVDETIKVLKKSHTALIVLTNEYLDNPAKVFEFTEAYKIMVRQRQGRLIIVKSSDVTACRQAYLNAFIRLKKFVDRDDVNLIEKILEEVKKETSQTQNRGVRSASQEVLTG